MDGQDGFQGGVGPDVADDVALGDPIARHPFAISILVALAATSCDVGLPKIEAATATAGRRLVRERQISGISIVTPSLSRKFERTGVRLSIVIHGFAPAPTARHRSAQAIGLGC